MHNKSNGKLGTPTSKANRKWFEEKKKHAGLAEKKKSLVSRKKKRSNRQEVSASSGRRGAFLNFYLKGKMAHSLKLLGAAAILLGAPNISLLLNLVQFSLSPIRRQHLILDLGICYFHSHFILIDSYLPLFLPKPPYKMHSPCLFLPNLIIFRKKHTHPPLSYNSSRITHSPSTHSTSDNLFKQKNKKTIADEPIMIATSKLRLFIDQ